MSLLITKLLFALIACRSIFGYESVYDIIEHRNQMRGFNNPGHRYLETRDGALYREKYDRYPTFNNNHGSIYSSIHPVDRDISYRYSGVANTFGNGYDNLGFGNVDVRDRLHFFPQESFAQKNQHYLRNRFHPIYRQHFHPFTYDKLYYIRPRHEERIFDLEKKNSYDSLAGRKDNSELHKIDSVIANNIGNEERKSSENFRNNQISILNDSAKKESLGEKSHSDKNAENKSSSVNNKTRKKGHITKGFSTHHHKDETGNTTTFYDEFSDHGGQSDFKDITDGFGTRTTVEHFKKEEDGNFFNEKGGIRGNYGSGSVQDNKKFEKDVFRKDNHLDKDEKFNIEGEKENGGRRMNFFHSHHFDFGSPFYNFYSDY